MGVGIVAWYFQLRVVVCRVHSLENTFYNVFLLFMLGHAEFGTPCSVWPPNYMLLLLRTIGWSLYSGEFLAKKLLFVPE